ncbi:hypothetical protein LTR86_006220 [Recurvomyces mirabilis]|nr:hypothetical protein LTR86_006220 [Recurvomyces mirabilis]
MNELRFERRLTSAGLGAVEWEKAVEATLGAGELNKLDLWDVNLEVLHALIHHYHDIEDLDRTLPIMIEPVLESFKVRLDATSGPEYQLPTSTINLSQRRVRRLAALLLLNQVPALNEDGDEQKFERLRSIADSIRALVAKEETGEVDGLDLEKHKQELCLHWTVRLTGCDSRGMSNESDESDEWEDCE